MTRFRAATYNVHKCRGMDWRTHPLRILNVIRELNADIIALQEIFAPQAEYLAERLRMHLAFGPAKQMSSVGYGNSLLSRFPVLAQQNHNLTVPGREPRRCLQVELAMEEKQTVSFFAVHLGTSYVERRRQAALLLSREVLGQPTAVGRRIVTGDFNEWTRGLATRMLRQSLQSADLRAHLSYARTYPGILPLLHLDHFYYDQTFRLTNLQLHRTKRAVVASDHLPLTANFEVP